MRRDYFWITFLLCISFALFFVCFNDSYFVYGGIHLRDIGVLEIVFSIVFSLLTLVLLPIYAGLKKQIWITWGLSAYGLIALLPKWIVPSLAEKVIGEDASLPFVILNSILRGIYIVVCAPFVGISKILGSSFSSELPYKILPIAIIVYFGIKIIRYYRNQYLQDLINPALHGDGVGVSGSRNNVREATPKDVLGTVIMGPATSPEEKNTEKEEFKALSRSPDSEIIREQ